MEQIEIWKKIPEYEDYQVSNLGNVKSLKYGKERILKPSVHTQGYLKVNLDRKNNKLFYIHRLVSFGFIENFNTNFKIINHKDGNKKNNNINNLEWCNQSYNAKHSYDVLNRKPTIIKNRGKLILDLNTGVYYNNPKEVCDLYGLNLNVFRIRLRGKLINKTQFIYA